MPVKPARLFRYPEVGGIYRERIRPEDANLEWLALGEFELPSGAALGPSCWPRHEALLFLCCGKAVAAIADREYPLEHYDVLYVPRGAAFELRNPGRETARIWAARAPAENVHDPFLARFEQVRRQQTRIRRLKGKTVYLMFDVSEPADRLVAGYTFFEPFARSWPPHNHTDQEEIYVFLRGRGSMEVYDRPESLTFVHNVSEGDAVSIPRLNYHPVFSQESPLEFLWVIAGARYWVGDRSADFMSGAVDSVTT